MVDDVDRLNALIARGRAFEFGSSVRKAHRGQALLAVGDFAAWLALSKSVLAELLGPEDAVTSSFRARSGTIGVTWEDFDSKRDMLVGFLESAVTLVTDRRPKSRPTKSHDGGQASRRVFVAHGRDQKLLLTVTDFLKKLEIEPIVLHDEPSGGKTVIEKFEVHADVVFAVVLVTPDDVGKLATDKVLEARARQNVVFELGYFIARLGRTHVCVIRDPQVTLPSQLAGVVTLDADTDWRLDLARELHQANIEVDLNRLK